MGGRFQYAGEPWWNPDTGKTEALHHVGVRYGSEDYFVPAGKGRKLERSAADEVDMSGVAVARLGDGAIQALLINGVERYRETLF
ncbi:hypothetical protein [Sulfurivermis fontis]|uniref:hypothetical protein n=1 Tax=Sulfurivermis fontis TaxID=1972068 RepID=UPI000FDCA922|nr:hypothetical protein [Sulfurivermis fontis]